MISDKTPGTDGLPCEFFKVFWRDVRQILVSALNHFYDALKIAAKAVASRIKTMLPKLISRDQLGFIKDRFIGENLQLMDSVIKYTAAKGIRGLHLYLDFEKAFDTLEWPVIHKTLIKWINVFHCGIESCILNNGWSSNLFKLSRGVR